MQNSIQKIPYDILFGSAYEAYAKYGNTYLNQTNYSQETTKQSDLLRSILASATFLDESCNAMDFHLYGVGEAHSEEILIDLFCELYPGRLKNVVLHDISIDHVKRFKNKLHAKYPQLEVKVITGELFSPELKFHESPNQTLVTFFGVTLTNLDEMAMNFKKCIRMTKAQDLLLFDSCKFLNESDLRLKDSTGCTGGDSIWFLECLRHFTGNFTLTENTIKLRAQIEEFFTCNEIQVRDHKILDPEVESYRVRIMGDILGSNQTFELLRYGRFKPEAMEKFLNAEGLQLLGQFENDIGVSFYNLVKV